MDIIALLKAERDKVPRELNGLNAASRMGSSTPRRKMSATARARISAALKVRWAKVKGRKVVPIKAGKHHISPEGGSEGEMGQGQGREENSLALCMCSSAFSGAKHRSE